VTSLLNQLYTIRAPCNPWTSTLHCDNRNTPKHTQGWQKPAVHISPPGSPFPTTSILVSPLTIT
jgi:hypothetical protein